MADIQKKLYEEKLQRALRAKRRFKATVRHVIHNLFWLQDYEDEEDIDEKNIESIKRAVSRATKKKQGGLLSLKQKSILRKLSHLRTEAEKKNINKFLGGLKCFRRYPAHVQFELVSSIYFEYFGPNRVLVRQDHDAFAMYFLLTGEVSVSRIVYDNITNKWADVEIGKTTAGNAFGEVSLLHDVKRTATITTITPCELLVLKKDDFNKVLKSTIIALWKEIRDAMTKFSYFDNWTDVMIRECCILSKIKSYDLNEVILGDNITPETQVMVYFIIEGSVSIVESLFVEVSEVHNGKNFYKLYDIDKSTCNELDLLSLTSSVARIKCPVYQPYHLKTAYSVNANVFSTHSVSQMKASSKQYSILSDLNKYKTGGSRKTALNLPSNVQVKFMQVCKIGEKGTFMDNETLANRRVIANSYLKLLMIPSYWLVQQNKGNIWNRVTYYIERNMPSREQVFEKFIEEIKWNNYKKKLVASCLKGKTFYNKTTVHDIPYSIRAFYSQ